MDSVVEAEGAPGKESSGQRSRSQREEVRHSVIEVNNLHPAVVLDTVCDTWSSVRGPAAPDPPSQQRDVSAE